MSLKKRVEKMEKLSLQKDMQKFWVVGLIDMFYGGDGKLYWTDEPVMKGLKDFSKGKQYRKVKHPKYGYQVPKGVW
jgi:hypothetical protein